MEATAPEGRKMTKPQKAALELALSGAVVACRYRALTAIGMVVTTDQSKSARPPLTLTRVAADSADIELRRKQIKSLCKLLSLEHGSLKTCRQSLKKFRAAGLWAGASDEYWTVNEKPAVYSGE
jgi:hypothetical protein